MFLLRTSFIGLILFFLISPCLGQPGKVRSSVWNKMIQENPSLADDPNISWKDRLILYALNADQVQRYFNGADPNTLILESGETLQEYLDRKMAPTGSLFFPLSSYCSFFALEGQTHSAPVTLKARDEDLSRQGGSENGCGIPEDATALMVQLHLESDYSTPVRVKLWPNDSPEPAQAQVDSLSILSDSTMVVVPLSRFSDFGELNLRFSNSHWASINGQVVGYFRKSPNDNYPGDGVSFFTESTGGTLNDFFGFLAGQNTKGFRNSFYGREAGFGATSGLDNTGNDNSYFGNRSGYKNTTGSFNAFFGNESGFSNQSGSYNVFIGPQTGHSNTTGSYNVFIGPQTGHSNTTGSLNTFIGAESGYSNEKGEANSAVGYHAGWSNILGFGNAYLGFRTGEFATGSFNTLVGSSAGSGESDTALNTGSGNSFIGYQAGVKNTSGFSNVFVGKEAGYSNKTGFENTSVGEGSLRSNIIGRWNTAVGLDSLAKNETSWNTAVGYNSLRETTLGDRNTAIGPDAGRVNTLGSSNVFVGTSAGSSNTVESNNTLVGAESDLNPGPDPQKRSLENATAIGYQSYVSQSHSLVLGSIAGTNGATRSVDVGIGTDSPEAPLHIFRSAGKAKILVEEKTNKVETRTLLELRNKGGARITLKNTDLNTGWIFSTNSRDQFYFSRAGTSGAEMILTPEARLMVGPGSDTVFDLDPTGNLKIDGDLTAKGVTYASDRNKKKDFEHVDPQLTLKKLVSVPITEWSFKDEQVRHIGPMAQDFFTAFGVGGDNRTLNPSDTAGVTMAAIQGLYLRLEEEKKKNEELQKRIEILENLVQVQQ